MRKFILKYVMLPLTGRWLQGIMILLFWTVSFVALPAISGWFLATCSVVFITSTTLFSYLVPSSIIRLLTILRTAARYFERIENHKTTLEAQRSLQLKIFLSVARFPYFKKQVNNNSTILENSTHGIDLLLNHILLWILPFTALIISLGLYAAFLYFFSETIALEFILSSAILLFVLPQYIFLKNRKLYQLLKASRDENNQLLIESFRGSIEISKFHLEDKAIDQHTKRMLKIENLEKRLQTNSFTLQMLAGLGFSLLAVFIFWGAGNRAIDAPLAIGIFFGMLAQAELAEMLFAGKSEKSSVEHHVNDLKAIILEGEVSVEEVMVDEELMQIVLNNFSAKIPETNIGTEPIHLEIRKGDWIALYGATGKGKTTLLNSLFHPEYRRSGSIIYNNKTEISRLPVPECIYVTQKAYLLTGTLRENFESFADEEILQVLNIVDLKSWFDVLPHGLDTWLGENGETLSGGQRKKLLLAQALLKKPQLLVVDEPTAGISTDNAITIFQHIRKENPGITILMATHLKAFEKFVDRVVKL
jgi:ATP-binding cassette subfamily C protein CydC